MPNPWFRLYFEFAFDPKIQSMDETLQRRFIMLLCLQCNGDLEKLADDEIAFTLRIGTKDLEETKKIFIKKGFIDENWNVLNWEKRQYKSDSSTTRVRKYRENKKDETLQKRFSNNNVTPPDTDTDTDTDTDKNTMSTGVDGAFEEFWKIYPKKVGKGAARKAWKQVRAPTQTLSEISTALSWQTKTEQWQKDNGQFIPNPATYLNQRRWEDERTAETDRYAFMHQ